MYVKNCLLLRKCLLVNNGITPPSGSGTFHLLLFTPPFQTFFWEVLYNLGDLVLTQNSPDFYLLMQHSY